MICSAEFLPKPAGEPLAGRDYPPRGLRRRDLVKLGDDVGEHVAINPFAPLDLDRLPRLARDLVKLDDVIVRVSENDPELPKRPRSAGPERELNPAAAAAVAIERDEIPLRDRLD